MTELYNRYRPTDVDGLYGQKEAVAALNGMKPVPHAVMFTGPSGCGKTTCARILRNRLKVSDMDFEEVNAADTRGIDTIREIRSRLTLAPMQGKARMWLLDEVHKLTNDAQTAILKILEDSHEHPHSYFVLSTTDDKKVIKTVRTRCVIVRLQPVGVPDLMLLVKSVAAQEKRPVEKEVAQAVAEAADGSPRQALTLLQAVIGIDGKEARLRGIARSDLQVVAFDLVKALMPFSGKPSWPAIAEILRKIEDEEPEGLRQLLLACARTHLLKGQEPMASRAYVVIQAFRDPIHDAKNAGRAVLAANCREAWLNYK